MEIDDLRFSLSADKYLGKYPENSLFCVQLQTPALSLTVSGSDPLQCPLLLSYRGVRSREGIITSSTVVPHSAVDRIAG